MSTTTDPSTDTIRGNILRLDGTFRAVTGASGEITASTSDGSQGGSNQIGAYVNWPIRDTSLTK